MGISLFSRAEFSKSGPQLLTPKSSTAPKNSVNLEQPITQPNLLRPKGYPSPPKIDPIKSSTFESVSFSALLGTPLGYENFYEKRFASFGNFYLFSIPIFRLNRVLFLHLETGPGFSFAKLTFENPPQNYSHLFLVAPVRFRLIYSLSPNLHLEGLAGVMLRPIEYDSRETTDGGTHAVKGANFITGDVGVGLDYNLTPPLKVRLLIGYLFLAGGLELTL